MSEHPIEGLMTTAMSSIQDMIDVNTIIGEPIETSNNIVFFQFFLVVLYFVSFVLIFLVFSAFCY